MKENVLRKKSFEFALLALKEYKLLCQEQKEYILSKQLIKSSTSIGANIEEACAAQSRRDFLSKISISHKETRETQYWLLLLRESGYMSADAANHLLVKAEELRRIMSAVIITTKKNI